MDRPARAAGEPQSSGDEPFALGVTDSNGDGYPNDEIRGIIESTADDPGNTGWDRNFGWGRVSVNEAVLAVSGGGGNQPPVAGFSCLADGLSVTFTDASTDADGTIVAWDWAFGDGSTSTEQNPSSTYPASGTYSVSLTVTDDGGATDSAKQSLTVSSGGGGAITLTATGYKVRGLQKVNLAWTGATGVQVDIKRDGALLHTIENRGSYTSNVDRHIGGSYTYQVCETDGSACSTEATVTF